MAKGWKMTDEQKKRVSNGKKGQRHSQSEETRKKISKAHLGRKKNYTIWNKGKRLSEEHKEKLRGDRLNTRGEKNWKWKGNSTEEYRERRRFASTIQKRVFERDYYTCQLCGKIGGNLQVDHIQPWSEYIEGRFDINNCRTLCMGCHYFITFGKPMPVSVTTLGHNFCERNK